MYIAWTLIKLLKQKLKKVKPDVQKPASNTKISVFIGLFY